MTTIVTVVEGDGEVAAVPVLCRRLRDWLTPEKSIAVGRPIRVRRDKFLRDANEFRRMLTLAAAKAGDEGWILVVLDADDDCPTQLAADVKARAEAIVSHRRVSIVLANREYEAWFIASCTSLQGQRGFEADCAAAPPCESVRDAKGWIALHMPGRKYREATDQAALTAAIDLEAARTASRSFRKLCDEWERNVDSPRSAISGEVV